MSDPKLAPCPKCGKPSRLSAVGGNCLGCTMDKPDLPIWAQDRAREWLEGIYTNGFGEQATRLVLINDGPPRRDLGGWGREVLRDRLAALLREVSDSRDRDWQAKMDTEGRAAIEGLKAGVLAEVRRVVLGQRPPGPVWPDKRAAERAICDEILSRLEKL